MTTEWFRVDGSGVSPHLEDERMILIGDVIPDWVRIPDDSPLRAGERAKVLSHRQAACPVCRRTVRHLALDGELFVAQCAPGCGFLFYKALDAGA